MKTHKTEYESAIDRLWADMANWKADAAGREVRLITAVLVIIGLTVAILKFS